MADSRETLRTVGEVVAKPTDRRIVDKFRSSGIKDYVEVPCSITDSIHSMWAKLAEQGDINLISTTHEHNLVGIATGIYFGTGRLSLIHMQNSGLPNAADGMISFGTVYKIPGVALVTWRGSNEKDDSEPHQEIGNRTEALTEAVIGRNVMTKKQKKEAEKRVKRRTEMMSEAFVEQPDNIHGSRMGRGILRAIDRAVGEARRGEFSMVRLSPDAFNKTMKPTLPPERNVIPWQNIERARALAEGKGTRSSTISPNERLSRDEAIAAIIEQHPDAAILFSNGFTARAAQGSADRLGSFYNVGYMGGTLAVGWALARSNPDIKVVVVDGDQNAQMSNMKDHLAHEYPDNLNWYILNNGIGASVGTAESLPLAWWYYDLARVIPTVPDQPGSFVHPRVRGKGVYFDTDEAKEMSERIGPLPLHAARFRDWVAQQTEHNITTQMRSSFQIPNLKLS